MAIFTRHRHMMTDDNDAADNDAADNDADDNDAVDGDADCDAADSSKSSETVIGMAISAFE